MGNFQKLRVWQRAKELAVFIYKLTGRGAFVKDYGLKDQIRRAAVSVPSNIAEGQGRSTDGELKQFLGNARGSLFEVDTQIGIALNLNMIDEATASRLHESIDDVGSLLSGFIRSVNKTRHEHQKPRTTS